MRTLQPKDWVRPRGFANGIEATGRFVFVAGQIGWDEAQRILSDDFVEQTDRALANVVAVLAEAGAHPRHVARMTWYVVDKREYLNAVKAVGEAYRKHMGAHFPAMTLVEVKSLLEDRARVEIEATAVVPVGRRATSETRRL
jgi:enamine deaminase RidA (YjgF/YER057c/UK114 family)